MVDVAAAGEATASIPGSQSLIIGALELLFNTGCWTGGSTSIEVFNLKTLDQKTTRKRLQMFTGQLVLTLVC